METKKHKVSELEGALLDAAVAKAEGWSKGEIAAMVQNPDGAYRYISASTSWAIAGPIIEREGIAIDPVGQAYKGWLAEACRREDGAPCDLGYGDHCYFHDSPLIAAMRVYVSSKFGKEVELP